MAAFVLFFTSMLTAFADFLWMDSMKWIVGIILLFGVTAFIKSIINWR